MIDLLSKFSITDIITFTVLLALAIKGLVSFMDWAKERVKQAVHKGEKVETIDDKLLEEVKLRQEDVEALKKTDAQLKEEVDEIYRKIDLLIESDKDDIKAWITREHQYFCNQLGEIDTYSLDCIERRYKHYKDEHGNSFIEDLIDEIKTLPKIDASKALEARKKAREAGQDPNKTDADTREHR